MANPVGLTRTGGWVIWLCYQVTMETNAPQPAPTLTLQELQRIQRETDAACAELGAMITVGGNIRDMWNEPRKYFVPEIGSWLPFPNGHLRLIVEPVFALPDPITDPALSDIAADIILDCQRWEFARREIIPERFK